MRKSRRHEYRQAYNAQAAVDADGSQLVLGSRVSVCASDRNELVADVDAIPAALGAADRVLADSGYATGSEVSQLAGRGLEVLVSRAPDRSRCDAGCHHGLLAREAERAGVARVAVGARPCALQRRAGYRRHDRHRARVRARRAQRQRRSRSRDSPGNVTGDRSVGVEDRPEPAHHRSSLEQRRRRRPGSSRHAGEPPHPRPVQRLAGRAGRNQLSELVAGGYQHRQQNGSNQPAARAAHPTPQSAAGPVTVPGRP